MPKQCIAILVQFGLVISAELFFACLEWRGGENNTATYRAEPQVLQSGLQRSAQNGKLHSSEEEILQSVYIIKLEL